MTIIPSSRWFDQATMTHLLEHDPLVQRYRTFFALFDWSVLPDAARARSRPGKPPHPSSSYLKAFLLKIVEGLPTCTRLRRYLLEHPLLVLEVGFRPVLDLEQPYGFDVERTVPSARWLREKQRRLPQPQLHALLHALIQALREEIPGLGGGSGFRCHSHLRLGTREQPTHLRQGPLRCHRHSQR